jgi:cell wall-associated NlpC family hydrolase
MMRRQLVRLALLAVVTAASAACAGTSTLARPMAFPGAPNASAALPSFSESLVDGHAVADAALQLLGVDYQFGGEDPARGLDCSGLVRYVFDRYQMVVPRTVEEQFGAGERLPRSAWSRAEAGDLIFFTTTAPGATHVGIALGPDRPGEFVHAPGTGGVVRVDRFDAGYWQPRIVGVRRLLPGPHPAKGALLPLP